MKSDRIVVAAALVLAAVYLYATEQIPTLQIGDPMGGKAVPRMLGGALLLSAVMLWLETRLFAKSGAPPTPPTELPAAGNRRHLLVVAAVVGWTAVYFVVFERLGYALSTSAYLVVLMAYFNRGHWLANGLSALCFSFASYLAFTRLFGAQLAPGVLPF